MPEPVSSALAAVYGYAGIIWGWLKWPIQQIVLAFRINARIADLEEKVRKQGEQPPPSPSPYRKCPQCAERDLRLIDQYRYRPDLYDEHRIFHEKWRCHSCGHFEEINLPEPGG
jgi:hypothetical protein